MGYKVSRMFHGSFMDRKVQGCFKHFQESFQRISKKFPVDSWKLQESFKSISKMFQRKCYGNFRGVLKKFLSVLRKFHGGFREISRLFLECFTDDSRKF